MLVYELVALQFVSRLLNVHGVIGLSPGSGSGVGDPYRNYYYYDYYTSGESTALDRACKAFGESECETQKKVICHWRRGKCRGKPIYDISKHNFTSYTVFADKCCHRRNDVLKSSYSQIKTVKECLQKCSAIPKCVAAEWYPKRPHQCDLSSTCTLDHARPAPKKWGVYLFVKKQDSNGAWC